MLLKQKVRKTPIVNHVYIIVNHVNVIVNHVNWCNLRVSGYMYSSPIMELRDRIKSLVFIIDPCSNWQHLLDF